MRKLGKTIKSSFCQNFFTVSPPPNFGILALSLHRSAQNVESIDWRWEPINSWIRATLHNNGENDVDEDEDDGDGDVQHSGATAPSVLP